MMQCVAALEANVAKNAEVLDDLVEETATAYSGRSRAPPASFSMHRGEDTSADTTLASTTTTMRAILAEQATQFAANQRVCV